MGVNSDHLRDLILADQPTLDPAVVQRAADWLASHSCWSVGALQDTNLRALIDTYLNTNGSAATKFLAFRQAVKDRCLL